MRTKRRGATHSALEPGLILLSLIIVLGAFVRFHRLDAQSFWNDEGNSARIAERSIDLILEGAAGDVHPPGYYLLLHYWRAVFGQSEFALRSLSVVAGLALIIGTYLLGRHLFGPATGLTAAFLGAVSPFAVYYSQEARMYALLGALSALSMYFAARTLRSAAPPGTAGALSLASLAAYVGTSVAGLYTHYAFVLVLVAHNVLFGAWWLAKSVRARARWASLLAWGGAHVAILLLYLPWLPAALRASGWSSAGGRYQLGRALLDVFRVLIVGVTLPLNQAKLPLVLAGMMFLLSLAAPVIHRRVDEGPGLSWPVGVVAPLVYVLIPLALFFGLDLYKAAWLKFLIVLLPPVHVLVGRGADTLADLGMDVLLCGEGARARAHFSPPIASDALHLALVLPLAAALWPSLQNLYYDPTYFRDDYRQLAADVEAIWRPGDAIVLNAPNQWEVFTYYYPDREVYPAPYRPSVDEAERFLRSIVEEHERLFVLYWGDAESDPRKRIESWLAEHTYKAGDRWYGDVRLATYGVGALPKRPDATLDAGFGTSSAVDGGMIRLLGYALPERSSISAGDIVPVTLFWRAEAEPDAPYKVTLQVLDGEGELVAQVDTVPKDGLAPTTAWRKGQELVDRCGIALPDDVPVGRYSLIVALYHAVEGERLEVVTGTQVRDHLTLGTITVHARASSAKTVLDTLSKYAILAGGGEMMLDSSQWAADTNQGDNPCNPRRGGRPMVCLG